MDSFYPAIEKYGSQTALQSAINKNIISANDSVLIRSFISEKRANSDISVNRQNSITTALIKFRYYLEKEYSEASLPDIFDAINRFQSGTSRKGKPYTQNTRFTYLLSVKTFLLWLVEGNDYLFGVTNPAARIKKIKLPRTDVDTTSPDMILSETDIKTLIISCYNSRDRAFIATLYESGCRIAEICRLRWKDLEFDEYGVGMMIPNFKTQKATGTKARYTRLIMAREYLAAWKNDTRGDLINGAVFVTLNKGLPLEYLSARNILRKVILDSGMQKKITFKLFRNSRATHLVSQNYQESVIKQSLWGNLNTSMFKVYVKLGKNDIDKEFLRKAGIEQEAQNMVSGLMPRPCSNCSTINSPTSDYCSKCGAPVTEDAVKIQEHLMRDILGSPERLALYLRDINSR